MGTPVGAAEYLSNNGSCGYVVKTDEDTADAIWSIINGDKKAFASKCEKSAERFRLDEYIKKVERLIDGVIGKGKVSGDI